MTLEQQVTSLELSKRLKELGVKQESLFWWCEWFQTPDLRSVQTTPKILFGHNGWKPEALVSALTVAELGEMLKSHDMECVWFDDDKCWGAFQTLNPMPPQFARTEADARAKLLIYLLENNLLKNI